MAEVRSDSDMVWTDPDIGKAEARREELTAKKSMSKTAKVAIGAFIALAVIGGGLLAMHYTCGIKHGFDVFGQKTKLGFQHFGKAMKFGAQEFKKWMKVTHGFKNWQICAAAAGTVGVVALGVAGYKAVKHCSKPKQGEIFDGLDELVESRTVVQKKKSARAKRWVASRTKKDVAIGVVALLAIAAVVTLSVMYHTQIKEWMNTPHLMTNTDVLAKVVAPAFGASALAVALKAYYNKRQSNRNARYENI